MQWFYNLKIRSKLLLGFGLVALISGLIGGIAVVKMKTLDDRDTYLFNNTAKPLAQLAKISTAFQRMRSDIFFILQNPTTDVIERYAKKIDERYAEIVEQQKNYEGTLLDKEDEENYRVLLRLNQEFYTLSQTILQQLRAHRAEEAKALYAGEGEADRVRLQDHISKMLKANEDAAQRISIENTDHYESTRNQLVILILIGLVVAMVIGKYIADYLSHAITLVVARIESLKNVEITALETSGERLASGDMNITLHTDESLLDVRSSDELGLLSGSINQISGKIAATIGSITRAVDAIKDTVVESNLLVAAAAHGKLSTRGDAAKFKGSYRELISGLNATVDAVVTPINESSLVLSKMAEGDLTVRMNGDYAGDYRIIKDSINQLAESLDRTLNEVAEAAEATASAANQISSSTEEMAAGAHEQTQQAAEVASAIEEMSKTIIEATRNATAASEMAQQAGASAKEGGEVMMETIGGMNRIAEVVKLSASTVQTLGASSDQIGEIVQTIDDIADQTNLLALNAAIEAARAGEQGRGFAVVADEVRKLAERTTKATKEIAQMIKQIQKETSFAVESMSRGTQEVEQGKVMADKSGTSLKEIIHGAEKVVDVITQVAAASEEQSTASEQISRNIEAISSVTQESAAGTQQIARAAEDLNRLTQNLQEILGKFSLTSRASLHEVRGMTRSTQSQSRETRQLRRA